MNDTKRPQLSIHKKLGNIKFDQLFDNATIKKAEKTLDQSKDIFKSATSNDYNSLKNLIAGIKDEKMDEELYNKISELAFSIKSRATTGGLPLASSVANSLFKFCDAAADSLPASGYRIVKLHVDALVQIFEYNFAANDTATCNKLITGLEDVAAKYLDSNE